MSSLIRAAETGLFIYHQDPFEKDVCSRLFSVISWVQTGLSLLRAVAAQKVDGNIAEIEICFKISSAIIMRLKSENTPELSYVNMKAWLCQILMFKRAS